MNITTQATEQDFNKFVSNMGQTMDQLLGKSLFRFRPSQHWQPAINFYESPDAYRLCVDLAGINPQEVDLHAEHGQLRITGFRPTPNIPDLSSAQKIHVMEIDNGTFQRTVQIPSDVDIDRIAAKYRSGLLWISLPRARNSTKDRYSR